MLLVRSTFKSVVAVGLVFFNDTATTEIYTLPLHDALPISVPVRSPPSSRTRCWPSSTPPGTPGSPSRSAGTRSPSPCTSARSEEHTSELQSRQYLVCRLLLEKKKHKRRL